jgi:hypothetical protein
MSNIYKVIKSNPDIIKDILHYPMAYDGWSLQGFGMLRLYLTRELRLHIWDSRYRVSNVSLLHTHPWDFESLIVWGRLHNYRYEVVEDGDSHLFSTIQCGEGGCAKTSPQPVGLIETKHEMFGGGATYTQLAHEIHKSEPDDGTVTLVERVFKADTEHANVFWSKGTNWVSAEPRPASRKEVIDITRNALELWTS